MDLQLHWDKAFASNKEDQLGWYESLSSPSLSLIDLTGLSTDAHILHVGCGISKLTESLLDKGYRNITLTDISNIALKQMKIRLKKHFAPNVKFIQDDISHPQYLLHIAEVDLWHDRAVLHFLTKTEEQDVYFSLLKNKVKKGGYVIFAEFLSEIGATRCSSLDVHRYNSTSLHTKLGEDFKLIKDFTYNYITPGGSERPYIYTLFQRD